MRMTGAQLIFKLLERQGIETIAGIPGGANLPMYDALTESPIRHVLARHEQGAGFIAQGMARASGRAAVCFGTSGPGATNLLTAIADAKMDSIPLVAITGQVPLAMIGTDAFQETDTYGLMLPITKHNYLVRSAEELLEAIPEAFRIAESGRPGPVAIDVPKDVQKQVVEFDAWPEPGKADPAPAFEPEMIDRMVTMIEQAERPVLFFGGGIIWSECSAELVEFAERAALPATSTLHGLGAMPTDHPQFLGMIGMHGARSTNYIIEECDLLIGLGVRFDDRATGKVAQFCPEARIIHVDIDESELGKIKNPTLGMQADVGEVLRALLDRLPKIERPEWTARTDALRAEAPLELPGLDDPFMPYGLLAATARHLDGTEIVSTDVGQHQMWAAQAYPFRRPRTWLTSGGLGTMGFGLPAAIGAALAEPGRTSLCISGDGSFLMNIQELAVAAEEKVNVKLLLLNNNHLGLVRQQQELFFGSRFSAAEFHTRPDFAAIARAFGVAGYDLADADDPEAMLAEALTTPGPAVINVPIEATEKVFPMVPPGAANKDMIGGISHVNA